MQALRMTWRSLASFYEELLLQIGVSILWWITGGVFAGAAVWLAWLTLRTGDLWLVPLVAIPAGPATAALANVTFQTSRDLRAGVDLFWAGFRSHRRRALAVNALSMVMLALILLNQGFYYAQGNTILHVFSFFWVYLAFFWITAQFYLFPVLVGMEHPSVKEALKMTAVLAFANPFYSIAFLVLAALLTGISIAVAPLLLLAWPAVMSLMGQHSLKMFVEQAAARRPVPPVK